ncbi:hypothetical protein Pcinc_032180 [Petrolisthes cinctipes]|uniref:Uncharacterized protein n=1 Tax=Petrolisthes cinctipes TaxID=88211 RepID=A0AAE1EVB8_PETCI|nr:hypothetical protein Pcinc_032180 [Petrolisthes cinctipes]
MVPDTTLEEQHVEVVLGSLSFILDPWGEGGRDARTQTKAPNQDKCNDEGMEQKESSWDISGWTWVAVVSIMVLVAVLVGSYLIVLQYRNKATVAERCLKEKMEEGKDGTHETRLYDINNT